MNTNRTGRTLLLLGLVVGLLGFGFMFDRGEEAMEKKTIGERFHQETALTWRGVIGDVLGHRAERSTAPYLKLATEDLRSVALDLPAGVTP